MYVIENNFSIEALGMLAHIFHQRRPLQAGCTSRPVLDLGGGHQLATLFQASNKNGIQIRPGSIDCGGVSGGARPQNKKAAVLDIAHV